MSERVATPRVQAFLAAVRETASVSKAAKAAKIRREQHYRRYKIDPKYAAAFDEAMGDAVQLLEDEAVRRAHQGVSRVKYYQGIPCGAYTEYSDTLLMFLLRGRKPEMYREQSTVRVTGANGGAVQTSIEVRFVRAGEECSQG